MFKKKEEYFEKKYKKNPVIDTCGSNGRFMH